MWHNHTCIPKRSVAVCHVIDCVWSLSVSQNLQNPKALVKKAKTKPFELRMLPKLEPRM